MLASRLLQEFCQLDLNVIVEGWQGERVLAPVIAGALNLAIIGRIGGARASSQRTKTSLIPRLVIPIGIPARERDGAVKDNL